MQCRMLLRNAGHPRRCRGRCKGVQPHFLEGRSCPWAHQSHGTRHPKTFAPEHGPSAAPQEAMSRPLVISNPLIELSGEGQRGGGEGDDWGDSDHRCPLHPTGTLAAVGPQSLQGPPTAPGTPEAAGAGGLFTTLRTFWSKISP